MQTSLRFAVIVALSHVIAGSAWAQTSASPRLSIDRLDNQTIRLRWPDSALGFLLEETDSLSSSITWRPISQAPQPQGDQLILTLPIANNSRFFRLRLAAFTTISETSPANGERDVAVTRETVVFFSQALAANTILTTNNFYAGFSGRRLLSRVELASDRRKATLFFLEPLPGSTRISVVFDSAGVRDEAGLPLDADGDGAAGGVALIAFDTLSLTPVANAGVFGHVFASDPMTGTNTSNFVNRALMGVTISVDGMEETMRTTTDSNGFFRLAPVPPGRFFVHVDGRTAVGSQWPNGDYYPFVGKAWESEPGKDLPAGGSGEIFLPLVVAGTLQPVSMTATTMVTFPPSILATNPAFAGVMLMVPPNNLYSDDGLRGGRVGIAPVPPDRIPEPLPAGLEFPIVITVQTDGPQNFDRPVPVCFPNLPDPSTHQPLPPGTQNWLYSFDHDIGRFVPIGSMTVSADGRTICTDPGVGIREPGWHGSGPRPEEPEPDECENRGFSSPGEDCFSDKECTDLARQRYVRCVRCQLQASEEGEAANENLCDLESDLCYYDCIKNLNTFFGQDFLAECFERPLACYGNLCRQTCNRRAIDCRNFKFCLPRGADPPNPAARKVAAMANQLEQIGQRYEEAVSLLNTFAVTGAAEVPQNVQDQIRSLLAQAELIAGTNVGRFLEDFLVQHEAAVAQAQAQMGTPRTLRPPHPVHYAARVLRPSGQFILRGMTGPNGEYFLFVPRDGTLLSVAFFDPIIEGYDVINPYTRPNLRYRLPRFSLHPIDPTMSDFDQDGLPDEVEFVVGTDTSRADSDGDGIRDGAEVEQGTNPLDGTPAVTGIIASTPMPGNRALDIAAFNNLAVVAGGASGVSIFNIEESRAPTLLAQVDTPGSATRVAFSGPLIAVADGAQGLAVIDASTPATARLTRQLNLGSVAAVATAGNIAYAGLSGGEVVAVDMVSGAELARGFVPGGMYDLAVAGDYLYVYTQSRLQAVSLDGEFRPTQSVSLLGVVGFGSRRVFAGGAFAYANSGLGYFTFSLADPARPALLLDLRTPQFGWKQIVANGSGLGLAAVGLNGTDDGPHDVSLYDLSNPTNQNNFLTTFVTPGIARAVSIFNGLAYVADDFAGLQVVNYREYDRFGQPPTISLGTSAGLGVAPAGGALRVSAAVTDDVQVRNVEFYLDGALAVTDGNFPFEHRFVVPVATPARSNIVIRAKATDTGGNATWSDQLTLALVADARPPRATLLSPPPLSLNLLDSVTTVAAMFNKPLNPATVNSNTSLLFEAGPDGIAGNGDDIRVTHGVLSYRADVNSVMFAFAAPLPVGTYRGVFRSPLAALDGVALAEEFSWTFRVRMPATWIRDSSGFWDDPANWSDGAVPLPGDLVRIDRPAGNFTIIIRAGIVEIQSLQCTETLVVSNAATLTLNRPSTTHGFTLNNAVLRGLGDLEITGPFNWVTGNMLDSGRTVVRGTGVFGFGPFGKTLSERTLEVAGVLRIAGNLMAVNGSMINVLTGGLLDFQGDFGIGYNCCVGAVPTLNNAGTLRKSAGTGTSELGTVLLNNSGRVEVQSGTVELLGNLDSTSTGAIHSEAGARFQINLVNNALRLGAGAAITGAGAVRMLTGQLLANGDITASNLELDGGSIRGPGKVTVTGTMKWTGGTLIGPGALEIAPTATLQMTGPFQKGLSAYTLNNRGTMLWLDSGSIIGVNGAIINNLPGGLFEARSDAELSWNCCVGATPIFNNAGTLRKSMGTNSTTFTSVNFTNSGVIEAKTGTMSFSPGFTQTAAGTLSFDISGLVAGLEFGRVTTSGAATLAGQLTVQRINNYEPNLSDSFAVLTFGSRTGQFDTLTGLAIGNGKQFETTYTATSLRLSVVPAP